MRLAFKVAQHDRRAVLVGKSIELFVKQGSEFEVIGVLGRTSQSFHLFGSFVTVSRGSRPSPLGRAIGHAVKPGSERLANLD